MRRLTRASPQLIAGHGLPRHPNDLVSLPCIGTGRPGQSTSWEFRDPGTGKSFDIRMKSRLVTSTEDAVDAAVLGTGFVPLLHYQAFDALADRRLQLVREDFEPEPMPVNLVHVARGQMPLKMRRFLDFSTPISRQALTKVGKVCRQLRAHNDALDLSGATGAVDGNGDRLSASGGERLDNQAQQFPHPGQSAQIAVIANEGVPARRRLVQVQCDDVGGHVAQRARQNRETRAIGT